MEIALSGHGYGGQNFRGCVQGLKDRLNTIGLAYLNTAEGFMTMADIYRFCEDKLVNTLLDEGQVKAPPVPKTTFWRVAQDVLDFLNVNHTEEKEREKIAERLLADSITEMFQQGSVINEEKWNNASLGERKRMLEKLVEELNRIFGTDVAFSTYYERPTDGMISMGFYRDGYRCLNINEYIINEKNFQEVMTTVVHEMRHAYQHEVIRYPEHYEITEKKAQEWKANFDNYVSPDKDYSRYRRQSVEKDARDFSENKVDYTTPRSTPRSGFSGGGSGGGGGGGR